MSGVSSMGDNQAQINPSMEHLNEAHTLSVEGLGHSEEVETLSIDAMEVDVQVSSKNVSLLLLILMVFSLSLTDFRSSQK